MSKLQRAGKNRDLLVNRKHRNRVFSKPLPYILLWRHQSECGPFALRESFPIPSRLKYQTRLQVE